MPKRWGGQDDELSNNHDDSSIYLPDETLKKAVHNPNAFIIYKNGQILVQDIGETTHTTVETSWDYLIATVFVHLKDYCREQAVPLLDNDCSSADLEHFLQKFL